MKIAMSGATGFIGENLTGTFADKGWEVMPLLHGDFGLDDEAFSEKIKGADIVINLAGAAISARWTEEYKKIIYTSRINTTKKIVAAIGRITTKPRLFISTSAVGIYDTKGVYTEEDKNYADDFLGKLAFDWEQAALGAKEREIRTIIFRFGVVLGRDGGALNKMLPPFKLGLGGTIGDGRQPFPWVHIEDLISAYNTVIENESYEGIYNLTAPNSSTNKDLTKALGHVLGRPAFMRVPVFILRIQLGEAADAFAKGQRVLPKRLLDSGFVFKFTDIEGALADLLKAGK